MENYPEKDKIAMLTGTAIQDDETFKLKGGFVPEFPKISDKWWLQMATLYGNDILMVDYER